MRIIAGTHKGRLINTRKGKDTRPTLESVRESLFSIINAYLEDSTFLDLYSGSGAIGIEALSRGAKRVVMIEKDKEALRFIIENIDSLGLSEKCRAYKNEVLKAIEILGRKNEKFDIIFMDPPYHEQHCDKVIKAISKANILNDDGIIICEHHIFENLDEIIANLKKTDERKYNKKVITFYTKIRG